VRIGLFAPLTAPFSNGPYLDMLGQASESLGFSSLWLAEHVVLFHEYASTYPYADDGRIPAPPENGILDLFTSLSYLAAVTSEIRLGTGICLVPQRNPVYTAKEAANVDFLSGGRLDFGIGVGWLAEEFRAVEASFDRRGARCRSYLEVIRRLWREDRAEFKDEFYELPSCSMNPKPVQTPHPPIHFGGESDAALGRVADLGQGWYGFNRSPDEAAEGIARLRRALDERGRTLDDVQITISPYLKPVDVDALERYRDAGVDQVVVMAAARDADGLLANLEALAEQLVEPAKRL
jgi:probable F420-dependent oxidoreductase